MKLQTSILTCIIFFISSALSAQPQINGASCVLPATVYDYFISGNPDSVSQISICIQGGKFTDTRTACRTIQPHSSVKITWDEDAGNASISISYSGGENSLQIHITRSLSPGNIIDSIKRQMLDYNSIPAVIICSPATGGSCSPAYSYQWQQSSNALNWSNIAGAVGQNLPSQGALIQTVFYRRKITESVSGSITYSDVATVFVNAQNNSQ